MLEIICAIPENIGWIIVGAVGMLTAIMAYKVGKVVYQAIKDRLTEEDEDE